MKKMMIYLLVITIVLFVGCNKSRKTIKQDSVNQMVSKGGNKKQIDISEVSCQKAYISLMDELYKSNVSGSSDYQFVLKDLDNNGINELIIVKGGTDVEIYTFDNRVIKVGEHDFTTATTKLLFSKKTEYSGIFYFFVGGGYEWHGYISMSNNQMEIEELWNEDYSDIAQILGEERGKIEYFSSNEALIQESKKVYEENQCLRLKRIIPDNYNDLEEKQ